MNIQTSMTDDTKERIIAMRKELSALLATIPMAATEKQARAMRKAYEWLTDVTEPLTDEENNQWDKAAGAYCNEACENLNAEDYEFNLNDFERRDALKYME